MRRLSEINRYDKGRRGVACTRRRRVERDQYLGLRGGLPGHWKTFLQLVAPVSSLETMSDDSRRSLLVLLTSHEAKESTEWSHRDASAPSFRALIASGRRDTR